MKKCLKLLGLPLIIIAAMLNLSGCGDSRELNELGIVMGVGLDKTDAPGEIEMTVQIADVSGAGSSSKSKMEDAAGLSFFNSKETGPDVLTILHKFTFTQSRKLYFSHNQLIIFGEDLAKEGVRDSFDFFARYGESRMTVYVFVAKGKAGDILDGEANFEKIPAMEISTLMQDPIGSINKPLIMASDFARGLISETKSAIVPMIDIVEEGDKKQINVSGLAVFKEDRLVGELDTEESRGYQWVTSEVKYSTLGVEIDGELLEFLIMSSKGKFTPVIKDDGSVMIRVEITAEGSLSSQTGTVDFSELERLEILEKAAERKIKQEIETTLNKTRALGADIFGFGESLYQKYPREWKTLKPQWEEIYKNIEVEINVAAKVMGTGRITKPLFPEKE